MSRSLAFRRASLFCALAACLALVPGDRLPAGGTPVDVAGSIWSLVGKNKGSLSRVDKWSNPADVVEVAFGPINLGMSSLPAGMFVAQTPTLVNALTGTVADDGKGKLTFTIDQETLEDFTEELFERSVDDVSLDIQTLTFISVKAAAKARGTKSGEILKAKFAVKFFATGTADGVPGSAKGSFKFAGTGPRTY